MCVFWGAGGATGEEDFEWGIAGPGTPERGAGVESGEVWGELDDETGAGWLFVGEGPGGGGGRIWDPSN